MAGGQAVGWRNWASHSVVGGLLLFSSSLPQLLKLTRAALPEPKCWGGGGKQLSTDTGGPERTGGRGGSSTGGLGLAFGGSRYPDPSPWDASKYSGIALF